MSHGVEDSLYPFCRVPTTWQCPTPPMVTSSVRELLLPGAAWAIL